MLVNNPISVLKGWCWLPQSIGLLLLSWGARAATAKEPELHLWPPPGIYSNFVGVMISSSGGIPRYTLDGSQPLPESPGYWDPILVSADITIKAAVFEQGRQTSPILCGRYQILTNTSEALDSPLPLVIVNTGGVPIPSRDRIGAWLTVLGSENGRRGLQGPVQYSGRAAVGVRGSSTRHMPKKPYRIELQDEEGKDLKAPLLGMPKESDWILLACHTDRTLIRDALAYELWRQMGHYAPRCRFVELFVVETNRPAQPLSPLDYRGVYLLVEKIKRGKNRVAIEKLQDNVQPGISGGYLFKKDRLGPGERGLRTRKLGLEFVLEEPKEHDITPEQRCWLTDYLDRFEESLFGPGFSHPEQGYRSFINTGSFIDYHWMMEVSGNPDGYGFSTFLYKDRGQALCLGPVWDNDLSFGNLVSHGHVDAGGWQWERFQYPLYQWYDRLFEDLDFLQGYIDRWAQLRAGPLRTANVLAVVERLAAEAAQAQGRNFQRWPSLSAAVHANQPLGQTHGEQINALKRWVEARLAWIDAQGFPPPRLETRRDEQGWELVCTAGVGWVYYTTDGTDPRLEGGAVAPGAARYERPVRLPSSSRVVARVRSPFNLWSARVGPLSTEEP